MSTKKNPAKKAVAKKATTKKTAPKAKAKPSAAKKKSANAKKPQASTNAQALKALAVLTTLKQAGARRPTPNDPLDEESIILIGNAFAGIRILLEDSAANLRPLDRMRLNGVGIKKQGFIERAFDFAVENLQFLPQWLTI
jgi:hypothetical protein